MEKQTNFKIKQLPDACQKHIRTYQVHQFLNWGNVGLTLVILVLLLKDRGFNLFDISVLFAIYSATTLVFELPLGGLADGIGRKPVYMGSVFVTFIAMLGLLLFKDFAIIAIGFGLMGLGRALMSGTLDAWFVEKFRKLSPEYSSQPVLAQIQVSAGVGLAVFAIIGGLLTDTLGPFFTPYGFSVYDVPLIASLFMTLILALFTHIYIVETSHKINKQAIKAGFSNLNLIIKDSGFYALKHKIISVLLFCTMLTSLAFFTLETFWIPYVEPMLDSDFKISIIGVLTFVYFFSIASGAALSTPIVNLFKGNRVYALIGIIIVAAFSFFALSLNTHINGFVGFLILLTLFMGAINSPFASLFHDYVPDDKRSTLLSLESLVEKIGGLVGMLSLGYIAEKYSIATAWQIGAFIVLLAGLWLLILVKRVQNTPIIVHEADNKVD